MDIKRSEAWIRERFDPACGRAEMLERLINVGLNVEHAHPVAADFDQVIVAKIEAVRPHPNADKLLLCDVNDGTQKMQVVCGATNVRPGLRVAFAQVGAQLPELKIKQAKIRGEPSRGMICSAAELGVGSDHDGILELPDTAPIGDDLRQYLALDDCMLVIDLTPNRGDCLSIRGLARELAAASRQKASIDVIAPQSPVHDERLQVVLEDGDGCPHYVGRIIRNVNVAAKTPAWMKERLRRADIRSVDPVVDVTNYVLCELGQPMHAFDLDRLQGSICVRRARTGESLQLLNEQEMKLQPDSLLITDESGPIALAGVMGGLATSIRATGDAVTQHIFLESAYFNPLAIAGHHRDGQLNTDASSCYERGVDFRLQAEAMERATALLLEIAGGEPGPLVVSEVTEALPKRDPIDLRTGTIQKLLGIELPMDEVAAYFDRLGFTLESEPKTSAEALRLRAPSWRFDIEQETDLIEEVARLYGYDRLPMVNMSYAPKLNQASRLQDLTRRRSVADTLVSLGYQEAINMAFSSEEGCATFTPQAQVVRLQNPSISERPVMRTSLLQGLIGALSYNLKRQQKHLKLFESGLVFAHDAQAENGISQTLQIAGVRLGEAPERWHGDETAADFFSLKGDLERLFQHAGGLPEWLPLTDHPALHPNQSASLKLNGATIGMCGRLHPQLQQRLAIKSEVYLFELDATCFAQPDRHPRFAPISSFPCLRCDLAIVVPEAVSARSVQACIQEHAGDLLVDLVLFDLYLGTGVKAGMKSLAFGLTFQAQDRNLLESELEPIVSKVLGALERDFDASLRV